MEVQYKNMHYRSTIKPHHFIDLSDFEDLADRSFLLQVVQDAARNAINENKAVGLPNTFLMDGWIVQRMPDGEIKKIIEIKPDNRTKNRKIAKGTILCVKRSEQST